VFRTAISGTLRFAQDRINYPTPANVRPRAATVVQNVVVVAPGVLECVRENGHRAEVARLVHLARDCQNSVGLPFTVERGGAERVSKHFAEQCCTRGRCSVGEGGPILSEGISLVSLKYVGDCRMQLVPLLSESILRKRNHAPDFEDVVIIEGDARIENTERKRTRFVARTADLFTQIRIVCVPLCEIKKGSYRLI
jgi:hypothetical protein